MAAIKAALAGLVPTIVKDLWDRFKPRRKAPPGPETEPVETPPPTDPGPALSGPGGHEEEDVDPAEGPPPKADQTVDEKVTFRCRPQAGEYLVDAERNPVRCPCGVGSVMGGAWVRRAWPSATGKAYWYVTRKGDIGENKNKGYMHWSLDVQQAADFDVYAKVPRTRNRTPSAKYVVKHSTGSTMVPVDQRGSDPSEIMAWVRLGRFRFNPGGDNWVRLLNSSGHSEGGDAIGAKVVRP